MTHPCQLIAKAALAGNVVFSAGAEKTTELAPLPCDPVPGLCCLTGIETDCLPRKYAFSDKFTNYDLLKAPHSQFISVDAYTALKLRPQRGSSWFCDGDTFYALNRQGVREMALKEHMPPVWAAYATTSYKKHGCLRTKVNKGRQRVWLFENTLVDCTNYSRVMDWWAILNKALRDGFGRSILESLNCPAFVISKVSITKWLAFERWARNAYTSALYQFLCYLLPSQEELKAEGNTDAV